MAIIRSLGVGRARKSAGNLTYTVIRGRTIAKEKMVRTAPYNPFQKSFQNTFRNVSRMTRLLRFLFQTQYVPSKYGSSFNNFFKTNYEELSQSSIPEEATDSAVLDIALDLAPVLRSGIGNLSSVLSDWSISRWAAGSVQCSVSLGALAQVGDIVSFTAIINDTMGTGALNLRKEIVVTEEMLALGVVEFSVQLDDPSSKKSAASITMHRGTKIAAIQNMVILRSPSSV